MSFLPCWSWVCCERSFASFSIVLLLLARLTAGLQWMLSDYEKCKGLRLRGIPAEASGVTYSPVTSGIYVITRRPRAVGEYDLSGRLLRLVNTGKARLRDPEGITWMYDYTFAIAQEGSDRGYEHSSVSVVEIVPWRDEVRVLRRLYMLDMPQRKNAGLEGLTYDPEEGVLIGSQEEDPMQLWRIDPDTGAMRKIYREARPSRLMRDFASVYKRVGDPGIYVLSEPSERVFYLDREGRNVDGAVKLVDGKMPEGLTFTPDGALMVIVGEPNEMFIYSSIGTCDYSPDVGLALGGGKPISQGRGRPVVVTPGYCNYEECRGGGAQGSEWCRESAHNCVGGCGGSWCSSFPGVPPITPETYVAPPPPSPPPAPPIPWHASPANGYCNFDGCNGMEQGNEWCRAAAENCVACFGTWCPRLDLVEGEPEPLTADSLAPGPGTETPDGALAEPHPSPSIAPSSSPTPAVNATDVDSALADGYQALLDLVISPIKRLDDRSRQLLAEAIAVEVFGAEDAAVHVSLEEQSPDARRRLLLEESEASLMAVVLLADSPAHAGLLSHRLKEAVSSGRMRESIAARSGWELQGASVTSLEIRSAGVPAKDFPVAAPLPPAAVTEVYVFDEDRQTTLGTFSIIAAAAFAVLAGTAATWTYLRARRKRRAEASAGKQPDQAAANEMSTSGAVKDERHQGHCRNMSTASTDALMAAVYDGGVLGTSGSVEDASVLPQV
mmetsp:Transcript_14236/g.33691  ORF Transcript_14236/g.33691 Transcript_14236/m.33691 type:complete len:724 (-) Transcript_14236:261-2432(-)